MSISRGQPSPDAQPEDPGLDGGLDLTRFELTSHRSLGSLVLLPVKRLLRRLLHPVLARQVEFNRSARAAIHALTNESASLRGEFIALAARDRDTLVDRAALAELRARLDALEHRLLPGKNLELPLDRFRGSEEMIAERQRPYVSYFAGQSDVIDLGCGRGEFLELLREARVPARGVELDSELLSSCSARGLDVERAEAVSYLSGCLPDTLGGIFAAQLIEHLPLGDVARLIALASTRLRPGGVLLLETVNPLCFSSLAGFWLDPTHLRPIHPELLRWIAEREQLAGVEIIPAVPADDRLGIPALAGVADGNLDQFNAGIARVNETLFGAQAYALLARRAQ